MAHPNRKLIDLVKKSRTKFKRDIIKTSINYDKLLERLETGVPTFVVMVTSMWEKEGERTVEIRKRGDLEGAVKEATLKYNTENGRDDAQRNYDVWIENRGFSLGLPKGLYVDYIPKKNRAED